MYYYQFIIFLATLSTTNHSRSKSSTLPVSGRKKPSTLNIHHSVNNNTLISSSLSCQNQLNIATANKNTANSFQNTLDTTNSSNNIRKVPNKPVANKHIQNKQLELNIKPSNFNGLLTDHSADQRYNKKTAESK